MSVTGSSLALVAPLNNHPKLPDHTGLIPMFRWIGGGSLNGDASGGVSQWGITMPSGIEYNNTLWTCDLVNMMADASMGGDIYAWVEVRGGELIAQGGIPTLLQHWRLTVIPNGLGMAQGQHILENKHPMRMAGGNSYVRMTINNNNAARNYEFCAAGMIYLPSNLSRPIT